MSAGRRGGFAESEFLLQSDTAGRVHLHPRLDPERLIGVVDLAGGRAVHAVAGNRAEYQPIIVRGRRVGSPQGLLKHYRGLGLRQFYLADLDALAGRADQIRRITTVLGKVDAQRSTRVDVGFRGDEPDAFRARIASANFGLILATESVRDLDAVSAACGLFSRGRVAVSLDFRDGRFLSDAGGLDDWSDVIIDQRIETVIVLDVTAVGTGDVSAVEICRRVGAGLRRRCSHPLRLVSGGGVRTTADVDAFLDSGCDQILVATSLISRPERRSSRRRRFG